MTSSFSNRDGNVAGHYTRPDRRPAARGIRPPGMEYNPGHAVKSAPRRRRLSRRAIVLFFLSVAVIYYAGLGTIPLLEPDEGRYAEIPREMLSRGDISTPQL